MAQPQVHRRALARPDFLAVAAANNRQAWFMGLTSRRQWWSHAGAAFAIAGTALRPRTVLGQDLSSQERLDLIHSRLFHFDGQGEPVVSIGLCEGQEEVQIIGNGGVDVLLSGDTGTRIRGGAHWTIRRLRSERATQRYAVVLAQVDFDNLAEKNRQLEAWQRLGFSAEVAECGALFGFRGWMLDNRKAAIITGDFAQESDAESAAFDLARRYGAVGMVLPQRGQVGRGQLVAIDRENGSEINAHDVLWFAARHGSVLSLQSDGLRRQPGVVTRNYRGQLYVAIDRHGQLCAVNRVRESDLLAGVVPAEMPASSPSAALTAQAIAARGQMLTKIGTRHLDAPYVLCAHEHCQVYAGIEREDARSSAQVQATRGQVLMRPGGKHLVDTVYSANCGGFSEHNEEVWPGAADPQLRGRPDPKLPQPFRQGLKSGDLAEFLSTRPNAYCRREPLASNDGYRWQSQVDLASCVASAGLGDTLGVFNRMDVLRRGASGRVNHLNVVGSRKTYEIRGELAIRRFLGGLRSSMFMVRDADWPSGKLTLLGGGHGHGVGMCQAGAIGLAKDGVSAQNILAHYYAGAEMTRLW